MGIIQSLFCGTLFCIERVLTWACCAFLLILLMAFLLILMIYGISVGYHYAQKELASFAISTHTTTTTESTESNDTTEITSANPSGRRYFRRGDFRPVVRLIDTDQATRHMIGEFRPTLKPNGKVNNLDTRQTAIVLLETERIPESRALSPREKQLAKRLLNRFRRSQNATESKHKYFYYVTKRPYLRTLRRRTRIAQFAAT